MDVAFAVDGVDVGAGVNVGTGVAEGNGDGTTPPAYNAKYSG